MKLKYNYTNRNAHHSFSPLGVTDSHLQIVCAEIAQGSDCFVLYC